MIPGDDFPLAESDLLQTIGKYLSLYDHSERKRLILAQAYSQVVSELEMAKAELAVLKGPQTPD